MSLLGLIMQGGRVEYKIIFDGNSWIYGAGSTGSLNYPNQLSNLLASAGKVVNYINYGVSGQTIDSMQADASTEVDIHSSTHEILIAAEIVNQWGLNPGETKEVIYEKYKQYFLDRIAAGFKIVCAITPIDQRYYGRSGWSSDRAWFISQMNSEFPELGINVINVGSTSEMSNCEDSTYFTNDLIHPNSTGYLEGWAKPSFNFLIDK